jgi:hypothetical protein
MYGKLYAPALGGHLQIHLRKSKSKLPPHHRSNPPNTTTAAALTVHLTRRRPNAPASLGEEPCRASYDSFDQMLPPLAKIFD